MTAEEAIRDHDGLAHKLAYHYARRFRSFDADDLVQEARLGLMRAASKYEPEKGNRFSTYANWWIRAFISRYIMKNFGAVRRNKTEDQRNAFWSVEGWGRVVDMSLDTPLTDDSDLSFVDFLEAPGPNQHEMFEHCELSAKCARLVEALDDREAIIFRRRIYTDEKATLDEIGKQLGITRERVRQIEVVALKKLRKRYANNGNGKRKASNRARS